MGHGTTDAGGGRETGTEDKGKTAAASTHVTWHRRYGPAREGAREGETLPNTWALIQNTFHTQALHQMVRRTRGRLSCNSRPGIQAKPLAVQPWQPSLSLDRGMALETRTQ